jgi:hypothetical protein
VPALLADAVGADVEPALHARLGRGEQLRKRAHLVVWATTALLTFITMRSTSGAAALWRFVAA